MRHLTAIHGLCACLLISGAALYASQAVGPIHLALVGAAALHQRRRWASARSFDPEPPAAGGRAASSEIRRIWWERAAFAALVFFVADLFLTSRNLIGAALRLLVFIVFYQADNPQSPRGARQTLTLTFIQMVAATASTTEVGFSVWMVLYLLVFTYTIAALHAAERDGRGAPLSPDAPARSLRAPLLRMTGLAAPVVIACGLGVFFLIPHYGTGYFREAARGTLRRNLTGFSDRIELGAIGSIKKSHATVMRVRPTEDGEEIFLPLRMRGIALDHYDGRSWSLGEPRRRWVRPEEDGGFAIAPGLSPAEADGPPPLAGRARTRHRTEPWLRLEVVLEPLDAHVLFTPPDVVRVSFSRSDGVEIDRLGSVFTTGGSLHRFAYRTESLTSEGRWAMTPGGIPPDGVQDYLQVPPLDPRIGRIAEEVTRGIAPPLERARALESHLRTSYAYSLDVNDAEVASPLVHFLIERKPGHCEYFATALAILLRLDGIPSRVVNGFNGGERSELTGQVILRQSDAHAWVEAWIPGHGWITFDPTPGETAGLSLWDLPGRLRRLMEETEIAWDTWIVGLDLEDQQGIVQEVRDLVDLTLASAVIALRGALRRLDLLVGSPGRGTALALAVLGAASALAVAAFLALYLVRRLRARRGARGEHPATALFRRFERICSKAGMERAPFVSPGEFARRAGAEDVAAQFETARYGEPERQSPALSALESSIRSFRPSGAPRPAPPTSPRPG